MTRPIGHNNVAAIAVEGLPSTLINGSTGTEVEYLQQNINTFANDPVISFEAGVTTVNVDGNFGGSTESNLIKLQQFFGLSADGVYGKKSRNKFHDRIGVSPLGYSRLGNGTGYINYNDVLLEALDFSWVTSSTTSTLVAIAQSWNNLYPTTPLEYNDGSLIKGEANDDHNGHMNGKVADVRLVGSVSSKKTVDFLNIAAAHSNVSIIYFEYSISTIESGGYNLSTVAKNKLKTDVPPHKDHFHLTCYN